MHVHPAAVGLHSINTYGLANERAANARAAEVRKKLLKAGQSDDLDVSADPDATLLIGQWLDSRHSQLLLGDEYHAATEGKDPDLG
ncbi:MAG: hypothetical protein P4K93_10300 [Terracidiphilus sp.]|nr:hypothetical protein [Terracidiphilus sp.]MDR3798535.1 hypothetical protein [Terracidiphilus sp.]